jgi:CRP/FNR family transcriptional regulator, cyclic AMP receptor protein
LVTFKACQFVTAGGFTDILGTFPGRILADKMGMAWRRWTPLHAALRQTVRPVSFAPICFGINMLPWDSRPEGRGAMAIEKCIREFGVNDVIFEEGSTGRELFVVLDGQVEIAKVSGASKTVIVTLGKGEFFGEMAVIDGSSRSATAIAASPNTRVMRINHARFVYLVSQQPAFALMIMDALSKRLRLSNDRTFRAAASS